MLNKNKPSKPTIKKLINNKKNKGLYSVFSRKKNKNKYLLLPFYCQDNYYISLI